MEREESQRKKLVDAKSKYSIGSQIRKAIQRTDCLFDLENNLRSDDCSNKEKCGELRKYYEVYRRAKK